MNKEEWAAFGIATAISVATLGFCVWISTESNKTKGNTYSNPTLKALTAFNQLIEINKKANRPVIIGKHSGAGINEPNISYLTLYDHYAQIRDQLKTGINVVMYPDSNRIFIYLLGYENDPFPICLYTYGKTKVNASYIQLPRTLKPLSTYQEVKKYIEDYYALD